MTSDNSKSGVAPEGDSTAVLFIKTLFGETTEHPVFVCSLPNTSGDPNEPGPRQTLTRDGDKLATFVNRWDRRGRGLFFCTGTVTAGQRRAKDTILETIGLWTDIDFKAVDADEPTIREKLRLLRLPPTALVRSGHGLHVYWLFKEGLESQPNQERIEAALRQLADLVAGDLQVAELSRLMRLPGSHNTKGGAWTDVVCEFTDGPRYELDDLEDWLAETAPVLRRKAAGENPGAAFRPNGGDGNPFLRAAQLMGFKPPLDVEQALAGMTFGNIHATQLSVSASLLNAGEEPDYVEHVLIEATKAAAGDIGTRWNWKREQKALRGMCASWLKKRAKDPPPTEPPVRAPEPRPVADLGQERAARAQLKPVPKAKKSRLHIILGEVFLAGLEAADQTLKFTPQGDYRYQDGLWRLEGDITPWLNGQLEIAARALSMDSNVKLIGEARAWILRHPELRVAEPIHWDSHGQIPTLSGLVHPRTGIVTPAASEQFMTWRIETHYDPDAACPWWLQMLEDVFEDRPEDVRDDLIQLIQEVLGCGLIDERDKALCRAMIFQGGSDHGKSGMIGVLGGLFGRDFNATPLSLLDNNPHGTVAFMRRVPWVLDEAFETSKWHMSASVKAIISGDPIQINIKGGRLFTHRVTVPIFWGTNPSVQFKETTEAIINRILVIECKRKFDKDDPVGAALEARRRGLRDPASLVLRDELPGLLAWAVAGLRRALARGYFMSLAEVEAAGQAVRLDSNRVAGFVADCLTFNSACMVSTPDFAMAMASWWAEAKGEGRHGPSTDVITKDLKALGEPRIAIGTELRDMARRYYAGFKLNEEGLRHWRNGVDEKVFAFAARRASTSAPDEDPNRLIPGSWDTKSTILAMRAAHDKMARLMTAPPEAPVMHDNACHDNAAENDRHDNDDSEALSSTQLPDSPNEPPF